MKVCRSLFGAYTILVALECVGCGTARQAGVFVNVEGTASGPIAMLHVVGTAIDTGRVQEDEIGAPPGENVIMLPTSFALLLETDRRGARSGALVGRFEVCVTPRDTGGAELPSGCATEELVPGDTVEITVTLGPGQIDAGTDGGGDAGADAATCDNGIREGSEDCDTGDLGGEDCTTLGFSGGELACSPTCAFDTTGCIGPPTVPVQRLPINGSHLGSVHVAGSLTPTFAWEPSLAGGGVNISYELQYSTDVSFSAATTASAVATVPSHQPAADLPASLTVPVGARYYWRVRACAGASCSDYSSTWYVDVGRGDRDFNGDGYDDLVVGDPQATQAVASSGAAYLYFGGPSGAPNTTPDAILGGAAMGDWFGVSVAPAGDVNGDGFTDLVIGAMLSDVGGSAAGQAFLYLGGSGVFATTPAAVFTGETPGDGFGTSVASAGDLNADGFADVIIGAFANDALGTNSGRAYVYFGGSGTGFDSVPDGILTGSGGEMFGAVVASAGDVNGDGYADVIVGAPGNDAGGSGAGAAHLYLGGPGPGFDQTEDALLTGLQSGDQFGFSVAAAGDVNADGFGDVVVGASFADAAVFSSGGAYLFLGGPGAFDTTANGTLAAAATNDQFGFSVASAGDVNGDGFGDVVVGAPSNDGGGFVGDVDAGAAYVYLGGPGTSFDPVADATLTGVAAGDQFGTAVRLAGDVNGDGFSDVIVGAPANLLAGAAYVYLGGPGGSFDGGPGGSDDSSADGTYLGTSGFGAFELFGLFGFSVAALLPAAYPAARRSPDVLASSSVVRRTCNRGHGTAELLLPGAMNPATRKAL